MMYLPLEANIVGGFAHTHYNYHLKACPEIRKNVRNVIEKLRKMCKFVFEKLKKCAKFH